ncbi:hypothetical protein CLOSTHATH_00246 [Hungatella hathewayi DSM 13479]|uniref:Uncharacterized protein n=1 Tax=Hungatella hathewayi DSM 13479 TaxID=566550 RepID=D3A9H5_9FIRM|nr:hypothetical protein CLOSTHATH_00246 [Hungatella hathewayi DSM 13479]
MIKPPCVPVLASGWFWIWEQSLTENRKIPVSYDTGLIFL